MAVSVRVARLGALGIKGSQATEIIKRVNRTYPVGWILRYLPIHFSNRASRRYQYAPRAGEPGSGRRFRGSYTWRKLRQFHHTRPLEYSGAGRASVMAGKRAKATRRSATAVLPGRVFNFRNPHSRVDMRRDLTTVLDGEQEQLEESAQRKTDAEFNRLS